MNLQDRDQAVIWHPFTPFRPVTMPIPIVAGEGPWLIAEDGKRYLDAISSWWVNLHGHAHPYIAEKIYQQALTLEQVIFAGFTHRPAVELAERLLPELPGKFSKIFYSDNGSTATEVAIKMALQCWWNQSPGSRARVLAFQDAYHGDTFGAMSVSDRSVFTKAFHDKLFDVTFIQTPNENNIDELIAFVKSQGREFAAFIYEPLVQGAGGMKMYDALMLDPLLQAVQSQGIICIADEVMTGFGRTGKMFASAYCRQLPDIICLSKGLTGGTMALGVTAANERVVAAFMTDDKLKTFFHGHSFTANPLACTAALASLDLLQKEDCLQHIATMVAANERFTTARIQDPPANTRNWRCHGTIVAFEIARGKDEYLNNISAMLTRKAMDRGVYLRPLGNTVYIMPPYCISMEQLAFIRQVLDELIADI